MPKKPAHPDTKPFIVDGPGSFPSEAQQRARMKAADANVKRAAKKAAGSRKK